MTSLELRGPEAELHIKLLCRLEKRERRALIRVFFVHLRPLLHHFVDAAVDHAGDGNIRDRRARRRGIANPTSTSILSVNGAFGFAVRMRRLELGWTQLKLANAIGMRRSHLSDLERGLHHPSSKTWASLEKALEIHISPTARLKNE